MNNSHCQHWRACVAAVVTMIAMTASAQVEVEYFIDTDPGLGKAEHVATPVDADGNIIFEPPTSELTPGTHLLGIRAFKVVNEETHYAPTLMREFYVPRQGTDALITRVEYFWDEDPGLGNATSVAVSPALEVNLTDIELSTEGLATGTHLLGIRAYGNAGWAPTLFHEVYVPASAAAARITYVEYFWDKDPGFNNGTPVAIAASKAVNIEDLEISTSDLATGTHTLCIRAYGNAGWGPTMSQDVYVPVSENAIVFTTEAEYFIDEDPGYGQGTHIQITGAQEVTIEDLAIPTETLAAGEHLLGVRYQGIYGWSPTWTTTFVVTVDASDATITAAEYFFDEDPGYGKGTPLSIANGQEVSIEDYTFSTAGLSEGEHLLGVRYRGSKGWGPTWTSSFVVPVDGSSSIIASAEYFWNEDPGFGNGTPLDIKPGQEVTLDDVGIPSFDVLGDAMLFIRYRGTRGWSPTLSWMVMVNAEGNYVLDASTATDAATRTYQTLGDAVGDWTLRGVGDDITLTVNTTGATYNLDAKGDDVLAQFASLGVSLDDVTSPEEEHIITFTAEAGSSNTLNITTTAEGLPTVITALAHTATENVTLTVNGTAYNFAAASSRHESICSGTATTPVLLSGISSSLTVTWKAQPLSANSINGFVSTGTGDIPAMTLVNTSSQLAYLPYEVTLSDGEGNQLATYTYNIYVHPRVSAQAFVGMTPTSSSSLDPGTVTLKWNAINGSVAPYRLSISSRPINDPSAEAVNEVIDLDETSYKMTVESGRTYTWTVTAFGYCDELTSPAMTFTGRLLPDLVVESISLPATAEAGNTISVTAVIYNSGAGGTTETTWTDRLYYVIDSEDFSAAVQSISVNHSGVLASGARYEVTFSLKVPQVDVGQLRVFVATDVNSQVMETVNDNNRLLSAPSTLSPFCMNATDYAALCQFYTDFGGSNWNGTLWDTSSDLITPNNWSGVTFNTEGRVTAINLSRRGLVGNTLQVATIAPMTALTSLNLSYNQIDELTGVLPSTISSLDLSCQHRVYNNNTIWPGIDAIATQAVTVGTSNVLNQTSVSAYNHTAQNFTEHPTWNVYTPDFTQVGTLTWSEVKEKYAFSAGNNRLMMDQDSEVRLVAAGSQAGRGSAMPATLHFVRGDANLSGLVDVNDVQRTLNYVLNINYYSVFGLWSANTYTEYETEPVINIQDIVCTVDIVLENEENAPSAVIRRRAQTSGRDTEADQQPASVFYSENRKICLYADEELAAFDIELEGVTASQVKLLLNGRQWQMKTRNTSRGVRLIVFSPTGETLPIGTTEVLRLAANGVPVAAEASSPEAESIAVGVSEGLPTSITLPNNETDETIYDLGGRKVLRQHVQKGVYIVNGKKVLRH